MQKNKRKIIKSSRTEKEKISWHNYINFPPSFKRKLNIKKEKLPGKNSVECTTVWNMNKMPKSIIDYNDPLIAHVKSTNTFCWNRI